MKSNKFKIPLILLGILAILFGGLFYYASTKLKPEEIKKLAIEQTQKAFPKSEVQLDSVNIGWGLNFHVNLSKFSITAIRDNQKIPMIAVDHMVVKIPIWAIITGSGIVDVKLEAPVMNYQEFSEGNNWTYAMAEKGIAPDKKDEPKTSLDDNQANLGILSKSKINIKLSDIQFKYGLRDNSSGDVKISRFLVKGLNLESSTAFELASNAKFVMHDQSSVSFDTLVIGEFNIADLLRNGSATSVIIVKLNNISKTGLDWKFPEITTKLDVLLKKDGELSGNLSSSFEGQNKISARFKVTKKIEINDFSAEIILKDIAAIMGLDKSIDLSRAKLQAKGELLYSEDKKIDAQLSFSIAPGIVYAKDGVSASTTVSGELKGSDINLKVKTDALEGQITTVVIGQFNPNEKFDLTKLRPFDIKISASGLKVPEKFIRTKLWDKKAAEAKADSVAVASASSETSPKAAPVALPPSSIVIDWNNINIAGEDFSGKGRIVTSTNAMAIDNLNFKFSKGTGKLSQTVTLGKNANDSKFNFEIANLNISSFKSFLPPFIENFTGTFTGKVSGQATMYKSLKAPSFDVTVVADAKKGEVKKLNISEHVNAMIANIPVVRDQVKDKQFKIDGNFESLSFKGRFTNSQYTLSSFDFVGIDKKVQLTGNGEIYPMPGNKNSVVEVNFTDNTGKISEVLQKNTGSKVLPMKVTGPGFALKPEYAYTLSKIAKGAMKAKGEEKLKEVVQKNLDKVLPAQAKEKVKGLLDGFFKKK